MMVLIPPPIGIELVRQRMQELQAAAEQHRRLHPELLPASGRGQMAATTRRVVTGIRGFLMLAPRDDVRTGGALGPHDVPSRPTST